MILLALSFNLLTSFVCGLPALLCVFAFTGGLSHFLIFFFTLRHSFVICCKAGLVVLNSFRFLSSVKCLTSVKSEQDP